MRHSIDLPPAEANAVFALYVALVVALAVLNFVGGLLLGIRMCVSVMILKDPREYALVLQAASWIGSFEGKDDDDSENNTKKHLRRQITWSGSVVVIIIFAMYPYPKPNLLAGSSTAS